METKPKVRSSSAVKALWNEINQGSNSRDRLEKLVRKYGKPVNGPVPHIAFSVGNKFLTSEEVRMLDEQQKGGTK